MASDRAKYRDYVTYRLDYVSSMARAEASRLYQQQCGLDIRELRVLRRVAERPGSSVSEIVEATLFERTLVSRIISELVAQGHLERRISESDARQFNIDITPTGLDKVRIAGELGDRLNEDLLASLDPHEREVLDRCLEKLERWQASESRNEAEAKSAGNGAAAGKTTSRRRKTQSRGVNGNV